MRQAKKLLFVTFLISLFTVYQVDILLFTHVHYVNGRIITHTHPNQGEHSHSKSECACIHSLYSLFFADPIFTCTFSPYQLIYQIGKTNLYSFTKEIHLKNTTLRAPPSFTL